MLSVPVGRDLDVGIHGAGLARDERQVTWVMVGLQMHGGIVHATALHMFHTVVWFRVLTT